MAIAAGSHMMTLLQPPPPPLSRLALIKPFMASDKMTETKGRTIRFIHAGSYKAIGAAAETFATHVDPKEMGPIIETTPSRRMCTASIWETIAAKFR